MLQDVKFNLDIAKGTRSYQFQLITVPSICSNKYRLMRAKDFSFSSFYEWKLQEVSLLFDNSFPFLK